MSYPVVHLAVLAIGVSFVCYELYKLNTFRVKLKEEATPEAVAARHAKIIADFHERRAQGLPGFPRYPSDGRDEARHLYHSCGRCRRDRE